MAFTLRLASYNVHGWVGRDRRRDIGRVMQVLASLDADIIALQEVTLPRKGDYAPARAFLEQHSGMHAAPGFTMRRKDAHYGNVLLSRLPFISLRTHDLSEPGRRLHEPRGLIEAVVEHQGRRIQLLATHLGLRGKERQRQVGRILEVASPQSFEAVVLMGDCNEWLPGSRSLKRLAKVFSPRKAPHTFPAGWPLFALDRIMAAPEGVLHNLRRHNQGAAGQASDHLPLTAELRLG